MYDDAENLASVGTDMRRCSDALGPRKNLHGRTSRRHASHRRDRTLIATGVESSVKIDSSRLPSGH